MSTLPPSFQPFFDNRLELSQEGWVRFSGSDCRSGATSFDTGVEPIAGKGAGATYLRIGVGQWKGREAWRDDGCPGDAEFDSQAQHHSLHPVSLESLEAGRWVDGEAITAFQHLLQRQPDCNLSMFDADWANLGVRGILAAVQALPGNPSLSGLEQMAADGFFDTEVARLVGCRDMGQFISALQEKRGGLFFTVNFPADDPSIQYLKKFVLAGSSHWGGVHLNISGSVVWPRMVDSGARFHRSFTRSLFLWGVQSLVRIAGRLLPFTPWQAHSAIKVADVSAQDLICPQQPDTWSCGLFLVGFLLLLSVDVLPAEFFRYFGGDTSDRSATRDVISRRLLDLLAGPEGAASLRALWAAHSPSSTAEVAPATTIPPPPNPTPTP